MALAIRKRQNSRRRQWLQHTGAAARTRGGTGEGGAGAAAGKVCPHRAVVAALVLRPDVAPYHHHGNTAIEGCCHDGRCLTAAAACCPCWRLACSRR